MIVAKPKPKLRNPSPSEPEDSRRESSSSIGWWENPLPTILADQIDLLNAHGDHLKDDTKEGSVLRDLYERLTTISDSTVRDAKIANPIAYIKPTYEQALQCNAWVWGITFICDFDANRKGKTTGKILSALLWMFPNDPGWNCFKARQDEWNRSCTILQRPDFRNVLALQDYLDNHPDLVGDPKIQPWEGTNQQKFADLQIALPNIFKQAFPKPPLRSNDNTIWVGAPDNDYQKEIVMPLWKEWTPKYAIEKFSEHDKSIILKIPWQERIGEPAKRIATWHIIFKSYDSKEEKWSGGAVQAILLTEGIRPTHLNEVRQRFKEDAFASWDYTPYENRNTGSKSNLAWKVFKGREPLPLRSFVFTGFGIEKVESHVLPEKKKQDLIRNWKGKPEGKARIDGNFFTSSGAVLTNLDNSIHCLDWTFEELQDRYKNLRLFRGLDPGWDHPCACAWGALNSVNTWFIYRVYAERGMSIPKRAETIITLSGNARRQNFWGPGENDYYWEEYHPSPDSELIVTTITDYHAFKSDETTGQPYSTNYIREGLQITRSTTIGPKERGALVNQRLEPRTNLAHPITRMPPGAKVYFLINEPGVAEAFEKMENLFWKRKQAGPNAGDPLDEIQDHGDDEFDAISYIICSPYVYTSTAPERFEEKESQSSRFADLQTKANSSRRSAFSITGY